MIRKEWFRPKKLRVLLAWAGALLLFTHSHVTDMSFRWGVILMLIGEAIRFSALGFVEKKGKKLAMSGPYAFVRNPLYVGNFFLGLGLVVIVANWFFIAIFLVGFPIIYLKTIHNEEKDLRELFGASYENYYKNVPRIFPRFIPYQSQEPCSFNWKRIWRHHEYVTVLGIALLLCGIHLYDELVREKDTLVSQQWLIIAIVIIAGALLLERIFISDLKKKFSDGLPNIFTKRKR